MPNGVSVSGFTEMIGRIKRIRQAIPDQLGRALVQEAEIEATEVRRRTPVRYGDLRRSVHVLGPFTDSDGRYALIVCGGVAAPYALYVHENLEAHHDVGQAKFLESVILESRPFMAARVAKRIAFNEENYGHVV